MRIDKDHHGPSSSQISTSGTAGPQSLTVRPSTVTVRPFKSYYYIFNIFFAILFLFSPMILFPSHLHSTLVLVYTIIGPLDTYVFIPCHVLPRLLLPLRSSKMLLIRGFVPSGPHRSTRSRQATSFQLWNIRPATAGRPIRVRCHLDTDPQLQTMGKPETHFPCRYSFVSCHPCSS